MCILDVIKFAPGDVRAVFLRGFEWMATFGDREGESFDEFVARVRLSR